MTACVVRLEEPLPADNVVIALLPLVARKRAPGHALFVQAVMFSRRAIRSSMGGCVANRWPGLPEIFSV